MFIRWLYPERIRAYTDCLFACVCVLLIRHVDVWQDDVGVITGYYWLLSYRVKHTLTNRTQAGYRTYGPTQLDPGTNDHQVAGIIRSRDTTGPQRNRITSYRRNIVPAIFVHGITSARSWIQTLRHLIELPQLDFRPLDSLIYEAWIFYTVYCRLVLDYICI